MTKKITVLALSLMLGAFSVMAQDAPLNGTSDVQTRNLTAGQKYKIKGTVVSQDGDSLIVRDTVGVETRVMTTGASIKTKGGFFGGGDQVASTQIVRGLFLEAEGRGDSSGALAATKIRMDKDDFRVAQSIETRVGPAETRLTAAEENARRVSGQIDELMAISNAARGGAKAAQETADAAIAGVNATNERITAMDDYVVQSTATVNFRVNSAVLSPEAKASLDEVATAATSMKGYVIEVTGFASADGSTAKNKALSKRRADAVINYLVETHNVPLRRVGTSFGFGELQAVADNTTREGREQNRRVEVKLLVSRGLNQNVEVRSTSSDPATTNDE
jgi:outer membrane protein OmpA-like peptidoglycan-associated protein